MSGVFRRLLNYCSLLILLSNIVSEGYLFDGKLLSGANANREATSYTYDICERLISNHSRQYRKQGAYKDRTVYWDKRR